MLKRNLIIVAIFSLAIVFTGNAFGQWHPEIDKVKAKRPVAKTTSVKSPRDVASGQSSQKTQKTNSRIQPPQPKGMNKADLTEQLSVKKPATTTQIGADLMEGTNIRRKQPRMKVDNQKQIKSLKNPKVKSQTGFMDYTDDAAVTQVQPGQNSGGTISNQVKGKRGKPSFRPNPTGDGTTEHFIKADPRRKKI